MTPSPPVLERFHRALVEEIRREDPAAVERTFTVAEIYQSLVPYRTHRDRIGTAMNGDYEDALLRLLAGEGDFLELGSDSARDRIRRELDGPNPNTGLYREFAALEVRLNPERIPTDGSAMGSGEGGPGATSGADVNGSGTAGGSGAPADPGAPAAAEASPGRGPESGGGPADLPDRCPDCAEALPDRDALRFCPFCGADPHRVSCSACGEVLERSWRFCIACGTPADPADP